MTLPFRMLNRNVLVGEDHNAAVYRLDTVSYPFLPEVDKLAQLSALARFAYSVGSDFSLYRVCRAYPASGYVEQAMSMLDERSQDAKTWSAFLAKHQRHLQWLGSFVPEVYLTVGLPRTRRKTDASVRARAREALGQARQRGQAILGRDFDAHLAAEDRIHRQVSGLLPVRRATTREIQWLLRRPASRGIAEPAIDENWAPTALKVMDGGAERYEPRRWDIERFVNAALGEHAFPRGLVVHSDEGQSFQSMLALGALPDTCEFPGTAEHLYTPLEIVPFPVDVVMHVRRIANRDATKTVTNKVVDADNVYADATTGTHGPLSLIPAENRDLARSLDAYVRDTAHPPLLDVAVSFAVGGTSAEEVEQRVDLLRQHYGTITLERPLGKQAELFHDHLPRPDRGKVRDYAAIMTVEQFGSLIPHGVHHVGADTGVYVARVVTGSSRPVKVDVTAASRLKRSPSILVCGTLGSGKTVTSLGALAMPAALRGSRVVTVDPKDDHRLECLPELAGQVEILNLSADEAHRGVLDPLIIGSESLREDLASSYLMELLPAAPQSWATQIRKAVKVALTTKEPSCSRVLDILGMSGDADARAAGEALEVWADSGVGRLAFGPSAGGLDHGARITTIRPGGLHLPGPEVPRGDYDSSERISVATLKLVAAYAMRLVSGDRSEHKMLVFDEAWFLLGSRDGRQLIDRINHYGRSNNATLVLATQRLGPVGDIEELIGTRIVHGQETETQARHALAMLGLDPEDRALVDRVRRMRRGRALMRDLDGRVAEIQVDLVLPHIVEALDVNREEARA